MFYYLTLSSHHFLPFSHVIQLHPLSNVFLLWKSHELNSTFVCLACTNSFVLTSDSTNNKLTRLDRSQLSLLTTWWSTFGHDLFVDKIPSGFPKMPLSLPTCSKIIIEMIGMFCLLNICFFPSICDIKITLNLYIIFPLCPIKLGNQINKNFLYDQTNKDSHQSWWSILILFVTIHF